VLLRERLLERMEAAGSDGTAELLSWILPDAFELAVRLVDADLAESRGAGGGPARDVPRRGAR